jgi:hypothetical protein
VCARKENGGEKKGKGKQILSGVFFQIQNGKKKKRGTRKQRRHVPVFFVCLFPVVVIALVFCLDGLNCFVASFSSER